MPGRVKHGMGGGGVVGWEDQQVVVFVEVNNRRQQPKQVGDRAELTSYPLSTAMWKERSCIGMTVRIPCKQSTVGGISTVL